MQHAGVVQASSAQGNQSSRPRQKQAACSLVMHALLPGPGMLEPALVTLSLFNPKLVLVRRFVNDVLYVTALFNHELAACSRADGSVKSKSKQETSSAAATVMLVTLHNVQVGAIGLSSFVGMADCSICAGGCAACHLAVYWLCRPLTRCRSA